MARRKPLCERYDKGTGTAGGGLEVGGYYAAADVDELPRAMRREDHNLTHGYAVSIGQWYFFTAIEPALAFGRAARMSTDCRSYTVRQAAAELLFCERHRHDERVLLITGPGLDRDPDTEPALLERFARGVAQHPDSSHWHAPSDSPTASELR